MSADALYDRIGRGYASIRRADPRLAEPIWRALGDAQSVVNIGGGSGSYEPPDREVITVDPSRVMIAPVCAGMFADYHVDANVDLVRLLPRSHGQE